ncbi:adenylyltransferase/cytidyltransferase family protein [Candidatus Woesearchaeota archaeon]|nr:adenylyltransferase/cytidyltransferase family protein [Candidatus Woesearchaeota archaeon]
MTKVLCFGTFDIVHPGHVFFLKKAGRSGELTVVIARDLTVKKIKGKFPDNPEMKRLDKLKKLKLAHKVILGNLGDPYKIIEDIKPDIICLGYDQNSFTDNLRKELKARNLLIEIIRLPYYKPHIYKSSKLR